MTPHFSYKNLVFEGSAISGLSYIGVLKILEDKQIIDTIENIIGTSSGAVIAAFVAIGYKSEQLYNLLKDINWKFMISKRNCLFQCFHFWNHYGIYKYNKFQNLIKNLFLRKLGKSDITFEELYNITNKNLIIVGVNVNKQETEYFSKDTTPDLSVITALKISTAFPFIFDPIKYNKSLYVDGGLMDNFAIEYFGFDNKETLGIKVGFPNKQYNEINNIFNFGMKIVTALRTAQEENDRYYKNIIYIELNVDLLNNVILLNQNFDDLYNKGKEYTIKYFHHLENNNEKEVEEQDCDS